MGPVYDRDHEGGPTVMDNVDGEQSPTIETGAHDALLPSKEWEDLSDWEQTKFTIRILREMFGLSDERLKHTYMGDDTPFDSGMINWQRIKEEQEAKLLAKKTRGRKKDGTTPVKRNTARSKRSDIQMPELQHSIQELPR